MSTLPRYQIEDLKFAEKLYGVFRFSRIALVLVLLVLSLTNSLKAEEQSTVSDVHPIELVQISPF